MKECCNNCRHKYDLVKFDYSKGGCEHTNMDGYVCALFENFKHDRKAIWMFGEDPEYGRCEMFEEKEHEGVL